MFGKGGGGAGRHWPEAWKMLKKGRPNALNSKTPCEAGNTVTRGMLRQIAVPKRRGLALGCTKGGQGLATMRFLASPRQEGLICEER